MFFPLCTSYIISIRFLLLFGCCWTSDITMALWDKSQRLQGPLLEQMKQLYGPQFPIEVRHYLANWIEAQSWSAARLVFFFSWVVDLSDNLI